MSAPGSLPPATRGVVGLGLAAALVPLNSTMIAVALPDIADDLDVTRGSTGLLITVYLAVMLIGQPVAGRVTDIVGNRRMLVAALSGFAALSVAASLAGSFAFLVVARGIQAVFGAALMPSAQSLLQSSTIPARRGRNFGILGSLIGVGAAAGPVIGGLVTQLGGWNGVFLINLPIVVIVFAMISGLPGQSPSPRKTGSKGPSIFSLLRQRAFGAAFATQATATLAQYSLLLVTPLVLDERGWTAGEIGLALTALTAGIVLMGPIGGRLGDRHGRRRPVLTGTVLSGAAVVAAALLVDDSTAGFVAAMGAFGFGFGLIMPGITTAALESVPQERAGSASGILSMSRYVGSIPASLLLATLVTDGDGATTVLTIASASMALAILAASRLPTTIAAPLESVGEGPSANAAVDERS